MLLIKSVWLTINRFCNFRCPWCYAKGTKYKKDDDMSFDLAKRLIDFSKTLGAKNVLLIGGEPSYYPYFFELVKYIKKQEMQSTLVTNGYRFKDINFVKKVEKSGLSSIGFSIKAANAEQQKELTKIDAFEDVKHAIKNLSNIKNISVRYSTVVSKSTINNIEEFAQMVADIDNTKHLGYSMCNPVFDENRNINEENVSNPHALVTAFVEKFDKINDILNNKVSIEQSLALCLWPKNFIKKLKEKNQISFGCHLQGRTGLVFDKDGKVVPCNSLPAFPIGQYGIDFTNKEDFERFWTSKKLVGLYDKIYEYPSTKCQTCKDYLECGGGCPLKWLAYNAKEVLGS